MLTPRAPTAAKLVIPLWVPDAIKSKAHELHKLHSESPTASNIIKRLAIDSRMRRVWNELTKQSRKERKPFHNLTKKFAHIRRDEAVAGIFEFAVTIGRLTFMLPSPGRPMRPFQQLAGRLRAEAKRLGKDAISQAIGSQLLAVAKHCERVTGARRDPDKAIATEIAGYLNFVFGSPKYGTAATITSVIVEHEISERKVRTWMSHPAK
jgi:hypothetical protein